MNSASRKRQPTLTTAVFSLLAILGSIALGCESSLATVEVPRDLVVTVEVTRVVEVERTVEVPVTRRVEVTRLSTVMVEATRLVPVTTESEEESRPQWELDYLNGGFTHAVLPSDTTELTRSFNTRVMEDRDGRYKLRFACLSKFVARQGWRVSHMGKPTPPGIRCEAIADIVLGRVYLAQGNVILYVVELPTVEELSTIEADDVARLLEYALGRE